MRYSRILFKLIYAAVLAALFLFSKPVLAQQTIPLNLSLDHVLTVNATITVNQAQIQNGQLVITASLTGTATVNGISASIATQPITVTAAPTCRSGTGTLILTTSSISLSLSNGLQATVSPLTVNASASCGRTPTLSLTVSAGQITLSDRTRISTSQCTVTASSPSSTTLGAAICNIKTLVCQLYDAVVNGNGDPVALLNQILTNLAQTLI